MHAPIGHPTVLALYLRDLKIGVRAGGGALVGVLFFLAVVAVVPFGVGPDLKLLARIGPAILWIGALLASLLGLERLFQADREDGSLDLLVLADERHTSALTVLVKCLAHWTASVLPLVIASPLLGLFMNMEAAAIGATTLTLLVGTPAIAFIGASSGVGYFLWLHALSALPASNVAAFLGLSPMLAVALSAVFLEAPYTTADAAGLVLVLVGLVVALWHDEARPTPGGN